MFVTLAGCLVLVRPYSHRQPLSLTWTSGWPLPTPLTLATGLRGPQPADWEAPGEEGTGPFSASVRWAEVCRGDWGEDLLSA